MTTFSGSRSKQQQPLTTMYCYVDMVESDEPVICGKFTLCDGVGTWVYGQSYLARSNAFSVDPLNLPLMKGPQFTTANKGIFGVLLDAGPDAWGQRLMGYLHATRPKNPVELLVAGSGQGVGCLLFSASRTLTKRRAAVSGMASLKDIESAAQKIESGDWVDDKKIRLLFHTPSLGGARPKTTVQYNSHEWIAKFKRPDDLFDVVRTEAAVANMARDAGVEMSESKLVVLSNRNLAFITRRFDVRAEGERLHFMSLHALINARSVRADGINSPYRYEKIADVIRKMCTDVDRDLKKAYRLIAFNMLVGNTDDHARNYAFLRSGDGQIFLSPAYDLVPQPTNSETMALSFDSGSRERTPENLEKLGVYFKQDEAASCRIINDVQEVIKNWQLYMDKYEVSAADQTMLKPCFMIHS